MSPMEPIAEGLEIIQVSFRDIRGFRELDLDLLDAEGRTRKRTLVIGKNGACKTSLLRALAIGLADRTDGSRLLSEPIGGLISESSERGSIVLRLIHPHNLRYEIQPKEHVLIRSGDKEALEAGVSFRSKHRPAHPFVCGYGAGRYGAGSETGRQYRIGDSVYSLFNYQQPLIDTELSLRRLGDFLGTRIYEKTLLGIKHALGLSAEDEITIPRGGGVEISGPTVGSPIRLEAWADGYRMTFSWILDLYAWAMRADCIDKDGHVGGILLIDEIEQHLHPSMQAEILPRLSELLPKMQIFATTHSPLVALDAKPEELVVLRREGDRVVAEESVPDFSGYSAEDMLSDPQLFDSEVYGQETREKLHEYRDLVSIPKEERTPQQRRKLRSLAGEVSSFGQSADRDSEATHILKQLIAKHNL
jgi:hypothetical protein